MTAPSFDLAPSNGTGSADDATAGGGRGFRDAGAVVPKGAPARTCCPLCGQAVPEQRGVRVDLSTNTLMVDGQAIRLKGKEAEMMATLIAAMPRTCGKEHLMAQLYGVGESPSLDSRIIDIYACLLRKRLRGTALRIDTVWGRGYRLVHGEGRA